MEKVYFVKLNGGENFVDNFVDMGEWCMDIYSYPQILTEQEVRVIMSCLTQDRPLKMSSGRFVPSVDHQRVLGFSSTSKVTIEVVSWEPSEMVLVLEERWTMSYERSEDDMTYVVRIEKE